MTGLSSKVSACLTMCDVGDSDVTEGSEDSDDVCSQPGHKHKNRWCGGVVVDAGWKQTPMKAM